MKPVLLIVSHWGPAPPVFAAEIEAGRVRAARQSELLPGDIAGSRGVITTMHLDQVDFAGRRGEVEVLLGAGGNVAFNGHIVRPFLDGLGTFVPLGAARLSDLMVTPLRSHPIFGAVNPSDLMLRDGVAGFYGRGYNPLPDGAVAMTGIGGERQPIDWDWPTPFGGSVFSHAGNDLWSLADGNVAIGLASRMVAWCRGDVAAEAAG